MGKRESCQGEGVDSDMKNKEGPRSHRLQGDQNKKPSSTPKVGSRVTADVGAPATRRHCGSAPAQCRGQYALHFVPGSFWLWAFFGFGSAQNSWFFNREAHKGKWMWESKN